MKMLSTGALAALAAGSVVAQTAPPAQFTGLTWGPSKLAAASVAKAADAKVASLRGIQFGFNLNYKMGPYTGGIKGLGKVQDAAHFLIEYPFVRYKKEGRDLPQRKVFVTANGRLVSSLPAGEKRTTTPIKAFRFVDTKRPSDWLLGLPRLEMGAFRGEAPLTALVTAASRPGSGFNAWVEERTLGYQGKQIPQRRIVVARDAAAARKLGPIRLEITIDVSQGLPVSAINTGQETGRLPIALQYALSWGLRPTTFPPSTFYIPK